MNLIRLLQSCFRSLFRNRMRSLLTSLGIIIGVGSVIIMLAVGEGAQKTIEDRIASMGTNLIMIMPQRIFTRNAAIGGALQRPNRITRQDAKKIKDESTYAMGVSGVAQRNYTVSGGGNAWTTQVQGVEPVYFSIRAWTIKEGYFFDENDDADRNRVAVIGQTVATQLFGENNPLNQVIKIKNDNFTVVGLLAPKGAGGGGNDQDDVIMIPLDTALTRLLNTHNINSIAISVVDKKYMEAAQNEAQLILRESHKLKDSDPADTSIMNSADLISMASQVTGTLTVLLAAIAGVSLLVGGIGIMNIMLVSVTERTREIGIRMAVGARKRDILLQFLSESVFLSLMGGLIGIGIAFASCEVLKVFKIPTSVNPLIVLIAALFACLIGVFFGYYPARKAASLYPIDALHYE
ncbi:MAG: ABC transporter permease [Treponema sp.]|nr:ABC transporter permease [Treponema sp.]